MLTAEKPDIRNLSLDEIQIFFTQNNEKPFRARQLYEWLWKKAAGSFDQMTNLSKPIREKLIENFTFHTAKPDKIVKSSDGTIKILFRLFDDNQVEGVLIPSKNRVTACISSQVGCALGCKFCATGQLGFTRNLHFGEIFDQVTTMARLAVENYQTSLSHIVYMGMGEPLLNYTNVLKSIEMITSANGLGMSPQRITVSTVGLPKMIKQLADDGVKFNLALSLHFADNMKRSAFMPVNIQNTIPQITEALKYYHSKTGDRLSIEYILFNNRNDSLSDARLLAEFCRNFPVKVNIIEYNMVKNTDFQKSDEAKQKAFIEFLENKNMVVNLRRSRGKDIAAACGQLAGESVE